MISFLTQLKNIITIVKLIYNSSYFNMDMIFIVVDKMSGKIGIFDCSNSFLERGKDKVEQAVEQYRLFYKNQDFDPAQYLVTKTL